MRFMARLKERGKKKNTKNPIKIILLSDFLSL